MAALDAALDAAHVAQEGERGGAEVAAARAEGDRCECFKATKHDAEVLRAAARDLRRKGTNPFETVDAWLDWRADRIEAQP